MWEKVSSSFMKDDKPYGPGDFRIQGDRFISMKLAEPEIKFRPMTPAQIDDPNARAEVAEPWMSDVREIANRSTVRILTGTLDGAVERRFEQRAQQADWWVAPDWSAIYLATTWESYLPPGTPTARPIPAVTKLWKSTDRGISWKPLAWPELVKIKSVRFLDAQRGYLVGSGQRLWRTQDGGEHWTEIPWLGAHSTTVEPVPDFDLVALGSDGDLRIAVSSSAPGSTSDLTTLYALAWGDDTPTQLAVLPGQLIMNLWAESNGQLLIATEAGSRKDRNEGKSLPTVLSRWNGQRIETLHRFEPGFRAFAIYRSASAAILLDGIDISGSSPKEVLAVSRDGGKEWTFEVEGDSAQGGYHDVLTGTRWRVSGFTLSKRVVR